MRKLRVVITGGAVPTILATMIAPMADACGSEPTPAGVSIDAAGSDENGIDAPLPEAAVCRGQGVCTTIVALPAPGTPADPGQLCAVATTPASSNDAARVTLAAATPTTAVGFVAVPAALAGRELGPPVITVASATSPELARMSVGPVHQVRGGHEFAATWPTPLPTTDVGQSMMVKASLTLSCDDGGTQTVESVTQISLCIDGATFAWISSGDACTLCCQIIAEMAPAPIVSDSRGDDLPLSRPLRLRVVEVARAGNEVLLHAENDAGADAEYEWRVSGGTFALVADDVILWSLPDGNEAPSGQVAVWNEVGAAVENFVWTLTGAAV